MFMQLTISSKMHKGKFFIDVEKIMSKMSSRIFMMTNRDQIRSSIILMKNMDKIKSQLERCRVLKVMNRFESTFKWQIMTARHVEE